ncbi:hypothetical protein P2318_29935 [Myxococcaceae bacterium GXIMD 01537]
MASDAPSRPTTRFFVLTKLRGGSHDTEFSTVDPRVGPAPLCPRCGSPIGALRWEPPYRAELELHGREFGELLLGAGGDLLVTETFARDFKAEGLTGLSGFHPVDVTRVRHRRRGPKPASPPSYVFVTPAQGNPAIDVNRSRLWIRKPMRCLWCRDVEYDAIDGLALEEETWGGEDVFVARGLWGTVLVSERFMRFAEGRALSHLSMVPLDKYVWDPLGRYYPERQQPPPGKS